ncbi:FISUMP domain-containing protein [Saccharicrinis fermentans]|uniref:Chitodextrinase n=1 Tax=Saccharicrinis fermentans DSM 9555 = JCM 21142 TaxID=869213 RepID=W7YMA1_9BACT|nr:FISUMP domain-containing protein [Saccharicrinis fermentans]GAF05796.1 chitodextrinase precursor [Saccharicrinis fermentans DSM 9555 = JCM 21142]
MRTFKTNIFKYFLLLLIFSACEKENGENKLPVCKIIKPVVNDTIQIGDILTISAEADDEDGNVTEVRFFADEVGVGSSTVFPYQYNWDTSDEEVGQHLIKAVAKDNEGGDAFDETRVYILGLPTDANAGEDQIYTDGETSSTMLAANEPLLNHGKGKWTIISGEGGSFDNDAVSNTLFTGLICESYKLRWTISTQFDSTFDDVKIAFEHTPANADAGVDQVITNNELSVVLSGNNPEADQGVGKWTIVSGEGGVFENDEIYNTAFIGQGCAAYILRWTISTDCSSSYDDVNVEFNHTPTLANAGDDIMYSDGRTTSTLSANNPNVGYGTGIWTILSGTGGSIADETNPNSEFTGVLHETYILRWTISTDCNSYEDDVEIEFLQDGPSSQTTDYDGNSYETVWLGKQLWMAENLKVTHYADGEAIPLITDNSSWHDLGDNDTDKAYCFYNNNLSYGAFYTYAGAVNGTPNDGTNNVQGVCPIGWHVPSDIEWTELENYLIKYGFNYDGTIESNKIAKSLASKTGWTINTTNGTVGNSQNSNNRTGFTTLPTGYRNYEYGTFYGDGKYAYMWSSTKSATENEWAWTRVLLYSQVNLRRDYTRKSVGKSVRCIKD